MAVLRWSRLTNVFSQFGLVFPLSLWCPVLLLTFYFDIISDVHRKVVKCYKEPLPILYPNSPNVNSLPHSPLLSLYVYVCVCE